MYPRSALHIFVLYNMGVLLVYGIMYGWVAIDKEGGWTGSWRGW